jgi:hypothetical protein
VEEQEAEAAAEAVASAAADSAAAEAEEDISAEATADIITTITIITDLSAFGFGRVRIITATAADFSAADFSDFSFYL